MVCQMCLSCQVCCCSYFVGLPSFQDQIAFQHRGAQRISFRVPKHRDLSGYFYFREYLSQGALRIEGRCEIVSTQAFIDKGLYVLLPDFKSFVEWTPNPRPPWAIPVIRLREKFYKNVAERDGITKDGLQAAINIGELFGQRWRIPVAINLIALIPHRSNDTNILLNFRSKNFKSMLLTAKDI